MYKSVGIAVCYTVLNIVLSCTCF